MKKFFIKADVYNELIEKGYGKRDLSKLTRKVITDKNGHRRTVFVRNDVQTKKTKKPTASTMEKFIYEDMKQHVSKYETDDLMSKRVKNMNTIDEYEKMFSKMEANNINPKKDRPDMYEIYAAAKGELRAINEELKARDKQRLDNAKKKDSKTSKIYWIQDFEGNRITSDDAKKKIRGIKDKLEYMESMKEGRSKDVVVSIDTSIRQLENYRDDLISNLNPEDRKEIESEKKTKSDKVTAEGFINKVKELFPNGSYDVHSPNQNELGSIGKIRASTKDIKGNEKDVKFEYIKDDTRKLSNGNTEKGVSVRIMGADYFIPETADAKRYVNNIITWNLNKELYGDSYKKHAVDYVETMAKDDTKFQSGVDYAVQYYKDNKLSGKSKEDAIKYIDYQIDNLEYKLNPDNSKDIHVSDVESNYKSLLAWKKLKKEYN